MSTLLNIEKQVFSPPELGCVLCLPGLPGGGSKIYDRSPYGNQGTITGATWKRLPSGLWYLSFDGTDDYIDLGSGSHVKDLVAATYGLWVNFDGLDLANALGNGFALTKDTDNRFEIGFGNWTGSYDDEAVTVSQRVGGSELLKACLRETGNNAKTKMASGWHLFMLATDASGNYFYLDGKQETPSYASGAVTTASVSKIPTATDLWISSRSFDGTLNFSGKLALPRIYNRALSGLEIQNHFNREKHLFGVW